MCGDKTGYYFSATCMLLAAFILFMVNIHKRNVHRHKHASCGRKRTCVSPTCPEAPTERKLSFQENQEEETPIALMRHKSFTYDNLAEIKKGGELTYISEEGIADMDLPDNFFEMMDGNFGDCITSCDQMENYLMYSEFEHNMDQDLPGGRGRKRSLMIQAANGEPTFRRLSVNREGMFPSWKALKLKDRDFGIAVIDEGSSGAERSSSRS